MLILICLNLLILKEQRIVGVISFLNIVVFFRWQYEVHK